MVGKILMRQALTRDRIPPMSLDICVAHSQGGIAYLLMQALENALREAGSQRHVACMLTQVEVDPDDPAFANPSKPIGPFFSQEQANDIAAELGWLMREDCGRGWRHVVASPKPRHIVDISLVEVLARRGTVVIAGGGGGIPVVRGPKGVRTGIAAVIDKDLDVGAHRQRARLPRSDDPHRRIEGCGRLRQAEPTLARARGAQRDQGATRGRSVSTGQHGAQDRGRDPLSGERGERAIIAHVEEAMRALRGETGTHIVADA